MLNDFGDDLIRGNDEYFGFVSIQLKEIYCQPSPDGADTVEKTGKCMYFIGFEGKVELNVISIQVIGDIETADKQT